MAASTSVPMSTHDGVPGAYEVRSGMVCSSGGGGRDLGLGVEAEVATGVVDQHRTPLLGCARREDLVDPGAALRERPDGVREVRPPHDVVQVEQILHAHRDRVAHDAEMAVA